MAATNDITGDEIKSKTSTSQYRENYSNIYPEKKSSHRWLKEFHPETVILDPDGWRYDDGVTMETRITKDDFNKRFGESTVMGKIS